MQKRLLWILSCCTVLAVLSATSLAGYVNGPPFTPQRTLEWTFGNSGDPWTPYTLAGPEWDSVDWECDEVRVEGTNPEALTWFDDDPTGQGHQGIVGISNPVGQPRVQAKLIFHVNNYPDNLLKKFWDEAVYRIDWDPYDPNDPNFKPGYDPFSVEWPATSGGYWSEPQNQVNLPGGWVRDNIYGEIMPNPEWEEFVWNFDVPPGHSMYLDSFIVSTLCIPEPGTLSILVIAGLALLRARRG